MVPQQIGYSFSSESIDDLDSSIVNEVDGGVGGEAK
jgi:hypothetical protein